MLNDRLSAARDVAAELFPAEADLERALVHASRLTIAIVEGRRVAKLPISRCQNELGHLADVTASLIAARGQLGEAHAALRETQIDIGLRAVSFGDLWDCPKSGLSESDTPTAANVA